MTDQEVITQSQAPNSGGRVLVLEGRVWSEEPHDNRPLCAGIEKGVEHVQADSMARRVQVPCGKAVRPTER
jgi:hypothetical protein